MRNLIRTEQVGAGLATLMLMLAADARADFDYSLEAAVGHTDNVTRVAVDEESQTTLGAGLNLNWLQNTRRFDGQAHLDLDYTEYTENAYDAEVVGTADAALSFGIIPERFNWVVTDNFGQVRSDQFVPVTPENRENINYFSTGPDFRMNLGSALDLQLFGRYGLTQYERSPLDATRSSAGLVIGRQMSQVSRFALNLVADQTDFDVETAPDYDRTSAFLSYEMNGGRTTISTRAGYSNLDLDGADTNGGAMFALNVRRQVSTSSALYLSASSQLTDNGELLAEGGGTPGTGPPDLTVESDPFENRDLSVEWRFDRNRTGISIAASRVEASYETQTQLNRTRNNYRIDYSRQLRPTLELGLSARLGNEEFATGLQSDEWSTFTTLNWQIGRHVGLRFTFEHYDRSTGSGIGEYTENRGFLTFIYSGQRASTAAAPAQ